MLIFKRLHALWVAESPDSNCPNFNLLNPLIKFVQQSVAPKARSRPKKGLGNRTLLPKNLLRFLRLMDQDPHP